MLNKGIYLNRRQELRSTLNGIMILVAVTVILLLGNTAGVFAQEEDTDVDSGVYDEVPWRITADNELLIGEEEHDYTLPYVEQGEIRNCPWKQYRDRIKRITVRGNVFGSGSFKSMFSGYEECTVMDLAGLRTENVTNMRSLFEGCDSLTSVDVSRFDTSKVTDMRWMFCDCERLTDLDVSGFDTSNVTDMGVMFDDCRALTSLDVSGFDTGKVTDMTIMFCGCKSLTSLDVSGFDTRNVTKMSGMFERCESLTGLDLSGRDTGKVTDMTEMFMECYSLASINLSGLDTGNVTDMGDMFAGCESLNIVDVSDFDTHNVTNLGGMFSGCESLISVDVSGFDTSNVTTINSMFGGCGSLTSVDLSGLNLSKVSSLQRLFHNCRSLTSVDLSELNIVNVKSFSAMFSGCKSLVSVDLSEINASSIRNLGWMFEECESLTSIDTTGLDTSYVTDMDGVFEGCSSLVNVDVRDWNTSNVETMYRMFRGCTSLKSIDLSGFDTSKVDDLSEMFYGCSSLTGIDLSGFDTSRVTDNNSMFYNCSSLNSIDISMLNIKSLGSGMFYDCSALTNIVLPDSLKKTGLFVFTGCSSLKEVEISDLNHWCAISFLGGESNPLNASPDAVLLLNGGTGSRVTLAEDITQIPDRTFNGWKYLKEINLPASLTKIGAGAFAGTDSLHTVNVDSIDQWLDMEFATESSNPLAGGEVELRVRSESEYDALSKVVINQTIGSIPAYAFSGCKSLKIVVIPDSVTTIGAGAFASCEALSQIVIPDSVSVLPERTFTNCKALEKILIPESVIDIDKTAFAGCHANLVIYGTPGSAAETFAAQQGIKFMEFSEYDSIEAGSINDDIRWILTGGSQLTIDGTGEDTSLETDASTFAKIADKVTEVKLKGITRIGAGVFSGLTKLERVTIDISTPVECIDPAAFADTDVEICCYPNSYDVATRDLPDFTVKKLSGSRAGNVTWTYNENTRTLMLSSGSAEFGETFTESPFRDMNVRSVEFSDSFACKSLPANLFAGCSSLTEVRLAAQTTEIGDEVFKDCTNLRRVIWHEGVTKIGEGAFENCTNLQQILLADSVLVNEYDQEMEDITVEIPTGVKVIPQRAFRSCRAIRQVDWYEDAETEQTGGSIGASAFENCSALSEIEIPEHVTAIGEAVFRSCTALCTQDGELLFSENLDTLGAQAFYDCPKILTMSFGKDLSFIGDEALRTGNTEKNSKLTVEAPESAANLKGYCRNAEITFRALEGMGDTQIHQDAYARLKQPSIKVKAGKSKKVAISTNGKVTGVKASNTKGKVSVSKSGHKVKFKGKSAVSGLRVKVNFNIKNSNSDTDSISVTVKKASSGLGEWTGDEQIIRADKQQVTFSSDAATEQKVRITRSEGAEGALICTVSKKGIVKYTMKSDGTLQITPVKAGKTTLTVYAEADDVFEESDPIQITITVKARPAKVTAKVKKLSKTKARVSWKKVNGVKSYQIQVSKSKTFKQKKTYSAKSTALKKKVKITEGKKNYIRVRYKLANGKVGKWSKTLVVKK